MEYALSHRQRDHINFIYKSSNMSALIPLTLTLCYYFACMLETLDKCISEEMEAQKTTLKIFFSAMIAITLLRLCFVSFLDYYEIFMC